MANVNVTNLYPQPTPGATDQRLTVSSSVVSLTDSFNSNTRYVALDVQSSDVMVTFDGSNPSSSNGHRLYNQRSYTWNINTAKAAKFIRQASTDAAIQASEMTD